MLGDFCQEGQKILKRLQNSAGQELEQELNKARAALRLQLAELVIEGTEKLLQKNITPQNDEQMLKALAEQI